MIWAAFAVMTGAVVLAVLWPLSRARAASVRAPDIAFYESQIEEIDRDLALGLLTPADAQAAKAEAGRRLLQNADVAQPGVASRNAVRAAAVFALVAIPAISLSLYSMLGNPDAPDLPLEARAEEREGNAELMAAISKIEQHLVANPEDGRGWDVIGPVYMKLGRYEEAARAFANAGRILGDTPDRLVAQGESLVYAAQERVTPEAAEVFEKALNLREGHPVAYFYLALAREQVGDKDGALEAYTNLMRGTPADAPWQPAVRSRILALGGRVDTIEAVQNAMPAEQQAMIRGMVAQLATRLEQDGSDAEGWLRLIRSYSVLRETDLAKQALGKARAALTNNAEGLKRVDALADELGLKG
mgnify:CR=1 FL=1